MGPGPVMNNHRSGCVVVYRSLLYGEGKLWQCQREKSAVLFLCDGEEGGVVVCVRVCANACVFAHAYVCVCVHGGGFVRAYVCMRVYKVRCCHGTEMAALEFTAANLIGK